MNKIILIAGYLAAGKSTFSQKLSQHLKIPCFNKDLIREVMADSFGRENEKFLNTDKKGSLATFAFMLHTAEQFLQTGNICILESNFQPLHPQPLSEMEQVKNLLTKYDCECLTYVFKGDLDIISERYLARDQHRHWIHVSANNKETVKNYCTRNKLDEFKIGTTIAVDTTSFQDVNYAELLDIAHKFIGKNNYN